MFYRSTTELHPLSTHLGSIRSADLIRTYINLSRQREGDGTRTRDRLFNRQITYYYRLRILYVNKARLGDLPFGLLRVLSARRYSPYGDYWDSNPGHDLGMICDNLILSAHKLFKTNFSFMASAMASFKLEFIGYNVGSTPIPFAMFSKLILASGVPLAFFSFSL
jgi:hypothetical protein